MRGLLCAVALVTAANPGWAAEEPDDGSYSMLVSAGVGRFTGDYGEEEDTTLDVLSLNARWYFNRAEFQVSLPYLSIDGGADVSFIDGQPVPIGPDSAPDADRNESGWGDMVLRGEYYLRTGTSSSPWVIGLLRVKLPTGDEDKGLGSGATDVEAGVGLIQRFGRINWLADVGYTFVGKTGDQNPKDVLRLGVGAAIPFGPDDRSSSYVYFENRGNRYAGSEDRRSIAVGVSTGLQQARRLRLSGSVFFGLSESAEDVGIYLTVGRRY